MSLVVCIRKKQALAKFSIFLPTFAYFALGRYFITPV